MQLSAEQMLGVIRNRYNYDPATGIFTWKIRLNKYRPGDILGSHDRDGYLTVSIFGHNYFLHRLAWLCVYKEWPENTIDHENGVCDANWIKNLRKATMQQNCFNTRPKGGKSKYKGVHWSGSRWRAQIKVSGKRHHLGCFDIEEDAAMAYNTAALEYQGEFAKLNEVSK